MYSEDWKNDVSIDEFWSLVELARNDKRAFLKALRGMERRGLIRFSWLFEEFASRLGKKPYSSHTNSTFSEDVLEDLWEEVVGRGQEFYENVVSHPEEMLVDIDYSDPSHEMRYEASNIFFERYGEEIPPYSYDY
ncbi:MAG: DUF4240 domain-containing protein [Cyanobacteria bacterium P01_A01_bin.135]